MRPRKLVIVVHPNPVYVSILRLVIETRGPFLVIGKSSARACLDMMKYAAPHIVVMEVNFDIVHHLSKKIKDKYPDVSVLAFSERKGLPNAAWRGDRYVPQLNKSMADFLYILRILAQRKRGPKKKVIDISANLRNYGAHERLRAVS